MYLNKVPKRTEHGIQKKKACVTCITFGKVRHVWKLFTSIWNTWINSCSHICWSNPEDSWTWSRFMFFL